MSTLSNAAIGARDIKRILDASASFSRSDLLATYWRLQRLNKKPGVAGVVKVLNYTVFHPDGKNLFFLYRQIFIERVYELRSTNQTPVVIDCGSNIGMSILFFKALFPEATVIGFEPHPVLFKFLQQNITDNSLTKVHLNAVAVGGRPGMVDFFLNDNEPGSLNMSLIARENAEQKIRVKVDLLSNHIQSPVDFLKLDIEGAESAVIQDLHETGKLQLIDRIMCEYHHHIERGTDNLSRLLNYLESSGFGYQLSAYTDRQRLGAYQDVMVYAYRKEARTERLQ